MQKRLAVILAADVVGYSAMMEQDEAGTFARIVSLRKDILEPLTAQRRGRIFKLNGDGILAEFDSALDAVECAVAIQSKVANAYPAQSQEAVLALRIGINLGDVIIDGEDRYGEGVNIAARLEQLAAPGSIWVSGKRETTRPRARCSVTRSSTQLCPSMLHLTTAKRSNATTTPS